jgi:serine/threonine protein phosphatase 1
MIAVIGDIHGCLFTLEILYNKIKKEYPGISVYSVGDLIDRGNFSSDVFEFVLNEGIKFTPGNHEYMFYNYFKNPDDPESNIWALNGNTSTLLSYENSPHLLKKHLQIIKSLPLFHNLPDCFISHAGIAAYYRTKIPKDIDENLDILKRYVYDDMDSLNGIIWTRYKLLNLGKMQVVGHTPRSRIILEKSSNALYIDTGVYTGKSLSAVIIDNSRLIESFSVKTDMRDLRDIL